MKGMFVLEEWEEHKGSGLLKRRLSRMDIWSVQGQCQDGTAIVGIPSSLESDSFMQCPPETQSVGLASLHRGKSPWPAHDNTLLSAGSENNNQGFYSFISF